MAGSFVVSTKLGSAVGETFTITDGTYNQTSTSITLLGHAAPVGYAYHMAKALVDILSNFASAPADKPSKPLVGQTWFDNSSRCLMIYTGSTGGWRQVYTDNASNMMIYPSQGGLGLSPTSASAGYVVRVNSAGNGYELTPGSFVRTDASSAPLTNNTFDIGTAAMTYKTIYASTFAGNASTTTKLQTARNISLAGHVEGTASFDGSSNVTINATLVGGTLSQYLQRSGDKMDDGRPLFGGIGAEGGFRFPYDAYGGGGDASGMFLQRIGDSGENQLLAIDCSNDTNDQIHLSAGRISIFTRTGEGGTYVPRMTVTPGNGFIGIGNTAPTQTLDITGSLAVSGTSHLQTISCANATFLATLTANTINATGAVNLSGQSTIRHTTITEYLGLAGGLYANGTSTFVVDSPAPKFSGILTAGDVRVAASDKKLKTNLIKIDNALDALSKITAYEFDYDMESCDKHGFVPVLKSDIGFIAQDVGKAIPKAYVHDGNYANYRERPILAYVVAAINELKTQLDVISNKLGV